MSKINKIRITNLNYNNNNFKINDEVFYLNGENTLLNLRNGGGKSVLVQMITAPFVRAKYRKTADRPFESYFKTAIPSYILVEWKLEHEAGFLLTGMMIRRKDTGSDEDSKEKLDIINFVHEYKERNEFDIESLKIVEDDGKSKKVKNFLNAKKFFEDLKKNRNVKFNYYDMTNSKTSRDYFNKLREYGIDNKEWESIIKQINIRESGLSELFNKAKDTTGLIKSWFIPNIEKKLDREENRIKNYRTLIESYVKQYKKNKSDIDKREKIEIFNNLSEELFNISKEGILNKEEKEALENIIINTLKKLEEEIEVREERKEEIEEKKEEYYKAIDELAYEELSIEIYKNKDKKLELEKKLKDIKERLDNATEEKSDISRKKCILECAKIYGEYTKYSKELQYIEDKIKALDDKIEDSKEEIENLGYTLKLIIEKEVDDLKRQLLEIKTKDKALKQKKGEIEAELNKDREYIGNLKSKKGEYKGRVDDFEYKEKKFNKTFKTNIIRNIEGLISEKTLLEMDEDIRNSGIKIDKDKKNTREEILELELEKKNKENEKEKLKDKITRNQIAFSDEKETFKELEKEIIERKEILKYIDFNEKRVFEKDRIVEAFNKRLEEFRNAIKKLENEKEKKEKEVDKLKTGTNIDIPKEVLGILKEKDIQVLYGLEWLKKNGNKEEDNIKLVEKNPFIPYSLIMEKREIEILKDSNLDFFTSNPILIIDRAELRNGLSISCKKIMELDKVKFLISFNNKLLNERELLEIIESKESEIKNLNESISEKNDSINIYDEKLTMVKISRLTEEFHVRTRKKIEDLEREGKELKENNLDLEKNVSRIESELKHRYEKIKSLEEFKRENEKKKAAFNEFKEDYKIYILNKEKKEESEEKIRLVDNKIKENEKKAKALIDELGEVIQEINNCSNLNFEKDKEYIKYGSYKEGIEIKKDKEDLEARFNSLTTKIRSSKEELLEEKKGKYIDFKKKEKELIERADEEKIEEEAYRRKSYNEVKEKEIKNKLTEIKEEINGLKKDYNETDKKIAVKNTEINNLYNELKEKCNKYEEKEKGSLIEKNFKKEVEKIKIEIKRLELEKKEIREEKEKLNNGLNSLDEFNTFKLTEKLDVEINIKTIKDDTGKLKRDLNNLKDRINENARILKDKMMDIEIRKEFKDETFFRDTIKTLKSLTEEPESFKNQLDKVLEAYNLLVEKLKRDLELIKKEEEEIVGSLLEYIEEINLNIGKIDENSTIEIKGRKLKMLNINTLNFEEGKEGYKLRLKNYVEDIRNGALASLDKNENIEDIISSKITTIKLYDEVIGIGTVDIKLYKIEEDKQRKISWQEVSKNSGGEGFLSAFVILSSLLSYIRRDETSVFSKKEEGKVLVMDNPFAQTNAAHLLKPLMDIAKKSNTQLICLTGLHGESIYNRFDNIYVLNLVSSRLKEGVKNLKVDHIKGEEESTLVASRFKIEEDQMKLF